MPSTVKQLVAPSFLAAASTILYTVPVGVKQIVIREISLNNTDTVTRTFTIAAGDPAVASNKLFDAVTIQAAGSEPLAYSRATVLKTGDTIRAYADVANKVGIMISGIEYT